MNATVIIIGLIALAMQFIMLKSVSGLKPEDILRVSAVTLIIIGTLFFIAAGFDSNQIAPAMGSSPALNAAAVEVSTTLLP